jgi:D-serine deaminase-like pyridoxal phosphate-dependent protein
VDVIEARHEQWLDRYRGMLGRARNEVTTPALLLDLDVAKQNISTMARNFAALPASLRPHIKVHKSPQLARLEVEAGAVGVACATVWEATAMADAGIEDVLIANEVVHPDKVRVIVDVARKTRLTIAIDDERNVDALSAAAAAAGVEVEFLIEVDVGMGRCGVRDQEGALRLAEYAVGKPALRMRGLQGYEGHCMLEPDPDIRLREAQAANDKLIAVADHLAGHGFTSRDLSAGGTGTWFITGANARITEVQAGSYALMDCFHSRLVPGGFDVALTVLGGVISRQRDTVVLDAGLKSVGIDHVSPPLRGYPEGNVRYYAEEHCVVDFPGRPPLDLGDTAEIIPGYGPTTVNLYDVFHVIEDGVVSDIWPITARGPGWPESST